MSKGHNRRSRKDNSRPWTPDRILLSPGRARVGIYGTSGSHSIHKSQLATGFHIRFLQLMISCRIQLHKSRKVMTIQKLLENRWTSLQHIIDYTSTSLSGLAMTAQSRFTEAKGANGCLHSRGAASLHRAGPHVNLKTRHVYSA